jgi:DNA-binding LytR/AlgR family response regulator
MKVIFIIRKSESYIEDIFLKMPKVTPYGILKKPINADKLKVYLDRLKESKTTDVKTHVLPFKATKMGTVYIPLESITFIKSVGRTVEVHTVSNQIYVGYEKLSNVYETLSKLSKNFYQCQKSYIVNVCAVTSIPSNENRIYVKGSNEYISLSNINGVSVSKKRKEIVQLKSLMTPKNTPVDD